MYAYAKARYLINSPGKRSKLSCDLQRTESVKHMFERHNIPHTASCDRKAATYQKALTNFVRSKSDEELKELMNDCYEGVPTDIAFKARMNIVDVISRILYVMYRIVHVD